MRWFSLVLFCLVLSTAVGDPDPKKYKKELNEKGKKSESLTDDEKKFLRDVEEKYALKSDVSAKNKNEEKSDVKENKDQETSQQKSALPAVIAIEILNDTESKSKGKRTIDANLGYGYRTNNGYSYTYFGKSNLDEGKFMIYPYSQQDIPPSRNLQHNTKHSSQSGGKHYSSQSFNVEIQPSQAYELVPLKDEQPSYEYKKPAIPFETNNERGNHFGTQSAGSYSNEKAAQTLYTTYNGQEFSGLSGQFPSVMSDYFVNPKQLLNNPQYQSAGLTQDHLQSQSSYLNQNKPIVPVLVLRIPSSYLNNPSAELYADLPNNYPLSQHLNHVNLQGLVNQYFKKHGYSSATQLMSQNPTVSNSKPQYYSNPHVRPSYTQADFSGIQYSAVKPVMAKYPATYPDQKYIVSQPQSLYQHPVQQQQPQQPQQQQQQPQQQQHQQYQQQYEYQYVPQTEVKTQSYYIQPQYQHNTQTADDTEYQNEKPEVNYQETYPNIAYQTYQGSSNEDSNNAGVGKDNQNLPQGKAETDVEQYYSVSQDASVYSGNQENYDSDKKIVASEQGYESPSAYSSPNYYSSQEGSKKSVSVHPSRLIHTEQYEETEQTSVPQKYVYKTQSNEDSRKTLPLSENYPSKDHTIATVLPYAYKTSNKPLQSSIQSVSYVTPVPSAKYQSKYKIMVPLTVLKNPSAEKVSYVNSHSLPMHYTQVGHYTDSSSESDYSAGSRYVSSVSSKHSYPRNYHIHPKRMVKQDSNSDTSSTNQLAKKQNGRNDMKLSQ